MYILNVRNLSSTLHFAVTKSKKQGPNRRFSAHSAKTNESPSDQAIIIQKAKKNKELSNSKQSIAVLAILSHCKDGVPGRGFLKNLSNSQSPQDDH